jgi:surfeit locus 1 family protein
MPAGYSFRPRLWALALGAAACAAGIALGNWQSGRADAKRAAAKTERVAVRGEFLAERTVLLDNKIRHGRAGYEVITPLRLNASTHVLVNRGWIEAGPSRKALPSVRTPSKEVIVEGIALARLPRAMQVGSAARGKLRQNLDIQDYAAETGLALEPRVIEQHSAADDGLLREWPRPDAGIEKHESYALQWYSLAGLAVVLFVVFSFRRAGAP